MQHGIGIEPSILSPLGAPSQRAWQVNGSGVRLVLIRHIDATIAGVSRLIGFSHEAGFAPATRPVPLADLFATEGEARRESATRRAASRADHDRRFLRIRVVADGAPA